MSSDPPSKKEQLLRLLDRGSVFVHLDPRRIGVRVPPWLAVKPQLVLQLGRNFAIPIPDLLVDDRGVRCTLSFNRSPFLCELPWPAVYALVAEDGQMTFWPTELPSELVPEPVAVRRNQPTSRGAQPRTKPRISAVPEAPDARFFKASKASKDPKAPRDPKTPKTRVPPQPASAPQPTRIHRSSLALSSDATEALPDSPPESPSRSPSRPSVRPPGPPGSRSPRERPPWLRVVK